MSIDREKINNLVRAIDILIGIDHYESLLDENSMETYIQRAIDFVKLQIDDEELAEIRREVSWKYQIKTTPGQSILADYEQDNW